MLGAWSAAGAAARAPGKWGPRQARRSGRRPSLRLSLPAPGGTLRLCRERPASGRCSRGGGRGRGGEREPTTKLGSLRPRLDLNDRSRRPRSAADTPEPVPPTTRRAAAGRTRAAGEPRDHRPLATGRARAAQSDFPPCSHRPSRDPGGSQYPALSRGPCARGTVGHTSMEVVGPLREQEQGAGDAFSTRCSVPVFGLLPLRTSGKNLRADGEGRWRHTGG